MRAEYVRIDFKTNKIRRSYMPQILGRENYFSVDLDPPIGASLSCICGRKD